MMPSVLLVRSKQTNKEKDVGRAWYCCLISFLLFWSGARKIAYFFLISETLLIAIKIIAFSLIENKYTSNASMHLVSFSGSLKLCIGFACEHCMYV